jgi:hypothetical protein
MSKGYPQYVVKPSVKMASIYVELLRKRSAYSHRYIA